MSLGVYLTFGVLLLSILWVVKSWTKKDTALRLLLDDGQTAHSLLKMVLHTPAEYFILFADKGRSRIDAVNLAFAAALGYSPEEIEGTSYRDLLHPEDVSIARPDGEFFSSRYLCRDGTYLQVTWRAVTTQAGVVVYSLGETNAG